MYRVDAWANIFLLNIQGNTFLNYIKIETLFVTRSDGHLNLPIRLRCENISPPGTYSITMYKLELSWERNQANTQATPLSLSCQSNEGSVTNRQHRAETVPWRLCHWDSTGQRLYLEGSVTEQIAQGRDCTLSCKKKLINPILHQQKITSIDQFKSWGLCLTGLYPWSFVYLFHFVSV